MRKIRAFVIAAALVVGSVVATPATAAAAGSCEDDAQCVIERPICRDEVPKIVRARAGCFSGDPT